MDLLRMGTVVKVSDQVNPRFAGRVGKVVTFYYDKKVLEYGLSFGANMSADAWFLPKEISSFFDEPKPNVLSGLDFPV